MGHEETQPHKGRKEIKVMEKFETGPEAKQRLIFETATRGELGLKLCATHYYAHVEGSGACIIRTAERLGEVLEELGEEFDNLDNLLDELQVSLESRVSRLEESPDGEPLSSPQQAEGYPAEGQWK